MVTKEPQPYMFSSYDEYKNALKNWKNMDESGIIIDIASVIPPEFEVPIQKEDLNFFKYDTFSNKSNYQNKENNININPENIKKLKDAYLQENVSKIDVLREGLCFASFGVCAKFFFISTIKSVCAFKTAGECDGEYGGFAIFL